MIKIVGIEIPQENGGRLFSGYRLSLIITAVEKKV